MLQFAIKILTTKIACTLPTGDLGGEYLDSKAYTYNFAVDMHCYWKLSCTG